MMIKEPRFLSSRVEFTVTLRNLNYDVGMSLEIPKDLLRMSEIERSFERSFERS